MTLRRQMAELHSMVDQLTTLLIVRDPGNALSADAYDGLRKTISLTARSKRSHISHLLSLKEILDRDDPIELIKERVSDFLSELGVPFRDAHAAAGRLVRLAESKNVSLSGLEDSDFSDADSRLPGEIRQRLDLRGIVDRRSSYGGTAPALVVDEATRAQQRIGWNRDRLRELVGDGLPQPLRGNIGE